MSRSRNRSRNRSRSKSKSRSRRMSVLSGVRVSKPGYKIKVHNGKIQAKRTGFSSYTHG